MVGFNYRMTNIEAAIGLAQLERIDWPCRGGRNRRVVSRGARWAGRIELSPEAAWAESAFWIMCAVFEEDVFGARDELMAKLDAVGIETRPFFYPLHTLPMYEAANVGKQFPVAENLACHGVNLPSSATLTRDEVAYVSEQIRGLARR